MKDAFSVRDLVVGKTGNLQVGQFVQPSTPKLVPISLEPQEVGERVERRQVCKVILRNVHIAKVNVGAQQVDVCEVPRRQQGAAPPERIRTQQDLEKVLSRGQQRQLINGMTEWEGEKEAGGVLFLFFSAEMKTRALYNARQTLIAESLPSLET